MLKTYDGGTNWTSLISGTDKRLWSVQFINQYKGWAVGDSGTIITTANGGVPVELTSFYAFSGKNAVNLNWTTATELNNLGFEIERSKNKINWRTIGFKKGNGTTTEIQTYSFTDENTEEYSSKLYYRLKQVDYDGSFEYSHIVEVTTIPSEYSLAQNYPNPFNPKTNIGFQIAESGFVTLRIYDALGNEVATLVNEFRPAGTYKVEFSAKEGYTSGVYFYRLTADNFSKTKKLLLMK